MVNNRSLLPRAEVAQGRLAAALILRLLVTWCDGCPPAVSSLLSTPSHLPLIVDMVAGRLGHLAVVNHDYVTDVYIKVEAVLAQLNSAKLCFHSTQSTSWTPACRNIDLFHSPGNTCALSKLQPQLRCAYLRANNHGRVARDDAAVCGLAAVLLGLCLLHNPASSNAQVLSTPTCLRSACKIKLQ